MNLSFPEFLANFLAQSPKFLNHLLQILNPNAVMQN